MPRLLWLRSSKWTPPLDGLSQGEHVVAKLYDPLYFDDDDLYLNPFKAVDYNYTCEVAAFETLSDLQGSTIPKYYGSYSLDIPVDTDNKRCVHLILIELISGSSMQNLDPGEMPQRVRQNILKSVIEFGTIAFSRKIASGDLHPRNIMLTSSARSAVFIILEIIVSILGSSPMSRLSCGGMKLKHVLSRG